MSLKIKGCCATAKVPMQWVVTFTWDSTGQKVLAGLIFSIRGLWSGAFDQDFTTLG